MSPKKYAEFLIAIAVLFAIPLSLPVSNLFIRRTSLASQDDAEFKAVSDLLIRKCADCHTKDLAEYPLYFNLPIASSMIKGNVQNGQRAFLLNMAKLSGNERFSVDDVHRLSQAMLRGDMPPLQYKLLHWDSVLNAKEQQQLVDWIQKRQKEYDIRPIPQTTFFRPDLEKANLGESLFGDKRLSNDESRSCSSCHSLNQGGTSRPPAESTNTVGEPALNVPTVFNAAYNIAQYWDGRAANLKEQALAAVTNKNELAAEWSVVIAKLRKDKSTEKSFRRVYKDGITPDTVSDAIAQYESTLLTPGSRFDEFLSGNTNALNAEEKEGYRLFLKHECFTCHGGPSLGGLSFEQLGTQKNYFKPGGERAIDRGRANVTHREQDLHRFKVPNLRNVELTSPYFHDGSVATLEEAVKIMSDHQIRQPLSDAECKKVVAFLRTLTAPGAASRVQQEERNRPQ